MHCSALARERGRDGSTERREFSSPEIYCVFETDCTDAVTNTILVSA
jgi:hypothetical protein